MLSSKRQRPGAARRTNQGAETGTRRQVGDLTLPLEKMKGTMRAARNCCMKRNEQCASRSHLFQDCFDGHIERDFWKIQADARDWHLRIVYTMTLAVENPLPAPAVLLASQLAARGAAAPRRRPAQSGVCGAGKPAAVGAAFSRQPPRLARGFLPPFAHVPLVARRRWIGEIVAHAVIGQRDVGAYVEGNGVNLPDDVLLHLLIDVRALGDIHRNAPLLKQVIYFGISHAGVVSARRICRCWNLAAVEAGIEITIRIHPF